MLTAKYIIVTGTTPEKLEEMVNEKIADGYRPLGGVSVTTNRVSLSQAMIGSLEDIYD